MPGARQGHRWRLARDGYLVAVLDIDAETADASERSAAGPSAMSPIPTRCSIATRAERCDAPVNNAASGVNRC
jgi:hypothetical protein